MEYYYYDIDIQFVKANVPPMTSPNIKFILETAKDVYNSQGLLAVNPKKIVELWPSDDLTCKIILRSKNKLDNPTMALRTFSSFLVGKDYLYAYQTKGGRLFKMTGTEIKDYRDPEFESTRPSAPPVFSELSKNEKEILSNIIGIFYSANPADMEIKSKLIQLYEECTETPF